MILHRKLAARVALVAITSLALTSSSSSARTTIAAAVAAAAKPGGSGGGLAARASFADGPAPPVTVRPKTGCPYLRALQAKSETLTKADLAPLRGVGDGVVDFFFNASPKKKAAAQPGEGAPAALDLDALARQRGGGSIEHPGSLAASPEFVADGGAVSPPRRDPRRLPLLLELLDLGSAGSLTAADVARASRLALELDAQFFAAKYGTAAAMGAGAIATSVVPAGEAMLVASHLADDAGMVGRADLLALLQLGELSTSAGPPGGKLSVPRLFAKLPGALARRAMMPFADRRYRGAAAALKKRAAAAGGSVLDLETGLVRAGWGDVVRPCEQIPPPLLF